MINVNERMKELALEWNNNHPDATEEERKDAFDEIAGQVIHEMMKGR